MYRLLCAVALSSLLFASEARAEEPPRGAAADLRGPGSLSDGSPHTRQRLVSGWLGFPYSYYGWGGVGFPLGIGASYFHPLVPDGFVPNLNDSFNLEAGVYATFAAGGGFTAWLAVPVTVAWALHFTPQIAGYLKLGAALNFAFGYWASYWAARGGSFIGGLPIGGVGVMVKLSPSMLLRIEAGYPWFSVGLGFPL
jgi:hypothetical protein